MKTKRKALVFSVLLLLSFAVLAAQNQFTTPNQLRVFTDSNSSLLVAAEAQVGATTSSTFSNTRLRTDADGNLLVVLVGEFPLAAPVACTTIPYSFETRTTTGLCSSAANTWTLVGGNTTGLDGTTARIRSYLAHYFADGAAATPSITFNTDATKGLYHLTTNQVGLAANAINVGYWGIPSSSSLTSNFFNITGTVPAVNTVAVQGVLLNITGAGSSAVGQRALAVNLNAGYTGSSGTAAGRFINAAVGTGTSIWGSLNNANHGLTASATPTTAGNNAGLSSSALGSSSLNIGSQSFAISSTNTPAINLGHAGFATGGTINVGGYFGLDSTAPTLGSSAALIADNGAAASDIVRFRDNGTDVFKIADSGTLTILTSLTGFIRADSGVISVSSAITGTTWTPTTFNVANLDAVPTAFEGQYIRLSNTVTFSFRTSANPTLATTSTSGGFSIPIASNFGAIEDAAGTCFASGIAAQGAAIIADTTNDRLTMIWISGDVSDQPMTCTGSYQVI